MADFIALSMDLGADCHSAFARSIADVEPLTNHETHAHPSPNSAACPKLMYAGRSDIFKVRSPRYHELAFCTLRGPSRRRADDAGRDQCAVGKTLGNDYIPAAVNMAIGLIATAVLTWSLTSEWPSREMLRAAPWYVWFAGGLMGTIYLTGDILLAPRLGAGELVGLVVAGQIIFSVLLDHFGWIGFAQHTAGLPRLAGCALMVAGVFLIAKF